MQSSEYEKMYEAEYRYFWFVGKNRLASALIERSLKGAANPVLLDIGCGTGGLLSRVSVNRDGRAFSLVGTDIDGGALAFCRERGLSNLARMDWRNPAFKNGAFDMVVASDFIEHLEDDVAALKAMLAVLKNGGTLLVTVPAMPFLWGPHDEALGHRRRYTRRTLTRALVNAGFDPVRVFSFMATLSPLLVPMRLLSKLGTSGGKRDTISYDPPEMVNGALLKLLDMERKWALKGWDLKAGSTLVALASAT